MSKIKLDKNSPVSLEKPVARFDPETGRPLGELPSAEKKPKNPIGCIAGFLVIPLIIAGAVFYLMHYIKENEVEQVEFVTTPTGDVEIPKDDYTAFYDAVAASDTAAMNEQLDKHPELIYIQGALYPMLDQVVLHCSPDAVQVMLDHGAKLDDRFLYEPRSFKEYTYQYTLENYFNRHKLSGEDPSGSAELEMVTFLLGNGAVTVYGYSGDDKNISNLYGDKVVGSHQPNALFDAAAWVCSDGALTSNDAAIVKLIADSVKDTSAENEDGKTASEYFEASALEAGISDSSSPEYKEITSALGK